jgi:hypothetical protein
MDNQQHINSMVSREEVASDKSMSGSMESNITENSSFLIHARKPEIASNESMSGTEAAGHQRGLDVRGGGPAGYGSASSHAAGTWSDSSPPRAAGVVLF